MRRKGGVPSSVWLQVVVVLALLLVCVAIVGLRVSREGWAPADDFDGVRGGVTYGELI